MPSQRQYPMAVASGAVALDWKQRSLLPSWMDSQMYAFAPDPSVIGVELMCLLYRRVQIPPWLYIYIDF